MALTRSTCVSLTWTLSDRNCVRLKEDHRLERDDASLKAQNATVEHLHAADQLAHLETEFQKSNTMATEQKSNTATAASQAVRDVARETDRVVKLRFAMPSTQNPRDRQFFIRDNFAHLLHCLVLKWTTIDLTSTEQKHLDLPDSFKNGRPTNALAIESRTSVEDNVSQSDMDDLYSAPEQYIRSADQHAKTHTKGKARVTSYSPAKHETATRYRSESHSSPRSSQSVEYHDPGTATKKRRSKSRQRSSAVERGRADTRRAPRSTPDTKHYSRSPAGGRKAFNFSVEDDSSSESDTGNEPQGVRIVGNRPRERSVSPIRRKLEPKLKATRREASHRNHHYAREMAAAPHEIDIELDSSDDDSSNYYRRVHEKKRTGRTRDHNRNTWGAAVIMRCTPRSTTSNASDYLSDSDDLSMADTIREPVLYRYSDSWTDPVSGTLWLSSGS